MNYKVFLTLSIAIIFYSCSGGFSKGVKKDLRTGLLASYNGFSIEDIYLASAEQRLNGNTIAMGTKVSITATGVENFSVKDGKVFPGCSMLLTDKSGKEILNLPDAFSAMVNGTTEAEAKILQASLTTGEPMITGKSYHLKARFLIRIKKKARSLPM
jgi:hypothetical protein